MCEALVLGTPIIASRISGLIGTLGEDYAGYFRVQDEADLAELLWRAERDAPFYDTLRQQCTAAAAVLTLQRERDDWARLLAELA